MDFERLPDEILLEICRFLPSTDILYSLFDINSRLNRTISSYCQHVILRLTSFIQFEYICLNILPKIGPSIRSLSVNANWTDLLAKRFHFYFGHRMKENFPNIEHLILVAFNGNELNDYIESISDLPYLNKLTIHDRYTVTEEHKQILFDKILSGNKNRLKTICFNRHSESLTINQINSRIYSNIIQLSIRLDKLIDFHHLLKLIPNIRKLSVIINKDFEEDIIEFDEFLMENLIEFHLESCRRPWIFGEVSLLLKQMPFLRNLSLDLFTGDFLLIDGQQIVSILPRNTLEYFNYSIEYASIEYIENTDHIVSSWSSTPYSVCCLVEDSRSHLFLHTIPYDFSYLDISSIFCKHMKKITNDYKYSIKELCLFDISTIGETFVAINNCNQVKDLELTMTDTPTITQIEQDKKFNLSLSYLKCLQWLSIDGCPSDGHLLKEILSVSPKLRILVIDMKYLLQLIDINDDRSCISLLEKRITNLSIEISDETELNDNNISRLSNIFLRLRHIVIENTFPIKSKLKI